MGGKNLIKSNRKVILEECVTVFRLDSATLPFRFHLALPQKLRDLMRFKAFLQAFCATHRQVNIRALP